MPFHPPDVAIGEAPGKLILFGEHAVVYGQPALATALGRGVRVQLRRGHGEVHTRLVGDFIVRGDSALTPRDLVHAALGTKNLSFDAQLEIRIPPMAGLGTSAAIAVATLRALQTMRGRSLTPEQLLSRAMRVEHLAHRRSSGLDPATCIQGGLVAFRRRKEGPEIRTVRPATSFHLVVGLKGSHGGTGNRVSAISALRDRARTMVVAAMRTLGAAAQTGTRALVEGDLELAGHSMNLAHGVLSGIGLVSLELEQLVRAARDAGAIGAKMSGAGGGGGAFYALAADIRGANTIASALDASGADLTWVETVA